MSRSSELSFLPLAMFPCTETPRLIVFRSFSRFGLLGDSFNEMRRSEEVNICSIRGAEPSRGLLDRTVAARKGENSLPSLTCPAVFLPEFKPDS